MRLPLPQIGSPELTSLLDAASVLRMQVTIMVALPAGEAAPVELVAEVRLKPLARARRRVVLEGEGHEVAPESRPQLAVVSERRVA